MEPRKKVSADTLALLEERLRRVDYILNGDQMADETQKVARGASAAARLRLLEHALQALASKNPAVAEVLAVQKAHPLLFKSSTAAEEHRDIATSFLPAMVLAQSQLYTSAAANLSLLQAMHIPDPAPLARLVELHSRIDKALARQARHAREFAELRARSAKVVEEWYEVGVLQMGEQWAEWEERVRQVEILTRRREAAKERDDGLI